MEGTTISCQFKTIKEVTTCYHSILSILVHLSCFNLYLAVSSSGLPVRALVLNKAFDIHAWSGFGRVCFQPGESRISVIGKFKKYIVNNQKSFYSYMSVLQTVLNSD